MCRSSVLVSVPICWYQQMWCPWDSQIAIASSSSLVLPIDSSCTQSLWSSALSWLSVVCRFDLSVTDCLIYPVDGCDLNIVGAYLFLVRDIGLLVVDLQVLGAQILYFLLCFGWCVSWEAGLLAQLLLTGNILFAIRREPVVGIEAWASSIVCTTSVLPYKRCEIRLSFLRIPVFWSLNVQMLLWRTR